MSDAWAGVRDQVARFFGRGDEAREQAERARLNQTAITLAVADEDAVERARVREEVSWQTRFEIFIEALSPDQRETIEAELQALILAAPAPSGRATIQNEVSGGTQYGPVMQGRDFYGHTFTSSVPWPQTSVVAQPVDDEPGAGTEP